MDISFEWDNDKDIINQKIHGISFDMAKFVFNDPYKLIRVDDSVSNNSIEDRYQVLGKVGKVLFVIITERGNAIRIISARVATAAERRAYYGEEDTKDWGLA